MKKLIFSTLLSIFAASGHAYDFGCGENNCFSFQDPIIGLGYYTGKYISIDRDYGEISLFVPSSEVDCWSFFLDAHGYCFLNGKWAGSVGGGVRWDVSSCQTLGVNVYYDFRRAKSHHNFNQIGVGFEWLSNCWDLRVNTYFNAGSRKHSSGFVFFDDIGDGFEADRRRIEYSYQGFDAEVGFPIFDYCDFDFYVAGGPYYYVNKNHNDFWGGYGRAVVDWKSMVSAEIKVSHDKIYHTNVQGIFRISFPFDFFCASSCDECCDDDCAYPQVYRNGVILTDDCCHWNWNWDDN